MHGISNANLGTFPNLAAVTRLIVNHTRAYILTLTFTPPTPSYLVHDFSIVVVRTWLPVHEFGPFSVSVHCVFEAPVESAYLGRRRKLQNVTMQVQTKLFHLIIRENANKSASLLLSSSNP